MLFSVFFEIRILDITNTHTHNPTAQSHEVMPQSLMQDPFLGAKMRWIYPCCKHFPRQPLNASKTIFTDKIFCIERRVLDFGHHLRQYLKPRAKILFILKKLVLQVIVLWFSKDRNFLKSLPNWCKKMWSLKYKLNLI